MVLCSCIQHAASTTILLCSQDQVCRQLALRAPDQPLSCCVAVESDLPAAPTPNSMNRSISLFADARQRSQLGDGYG